MKLTTDWYQRKTRQIQQKMGEEGLDALLLLDPYNIFYSTGFFHQSTERPLGLFLPQSGDPAFYVPLLEQEMASETWVDDVHVYFDFPGPLHPIAWMLNSNKNFKRIGIDQLVCAAVGYRPRRPPGCADQRPGVHHAPGEGPGGDRHPG